MKIKKEDTSLSTEINTKDGKILHYIRSNSTVLEFGPAYGRMTKFMKETLNCKVYIVEIDKNAYGSAIQYAIKGICGDILDFSWLKEFGRISFDHIIFSNVLEHLLDPWGVLEKSLSLLKDDGSVFLSVPNIAHNSVLIDLLNNKFEYTDVGLLDKKHIRFFTHSSLVEMLESCSLVPVVEDGTVCIPENTEFKNSFSDISGRTEILEQKEYANIYQFVFKCIKRKYYLANKKNCKIQKLYGNTTSPSFCNIYFDTGANFNPNEVLIIPFYIENNHFEVMITTNPDYKSIRFDPFEGYACILNNLQIITDNGAINHTSTNGIEIDGIFIFDNIDPQIVIDFKGRINSKIKISGDIYRYNFDNISLISKGKHIFEKYFEIKSEINELVTERDSIIVERNNLLAERNNLMTKYPELTLQNCTLFIDTGEGCSENEKIVHSFTGNEFEMSCQIPEKTVKIRLDPIEGYGCIISNLEILSFGGIVNYEPVNGYKDKNDDLVFINTDPQIELHGAAYWIKIKYRITPLSDYSCYKVFEKFIAIGQERDELEFECDRLITERDVLVVERNRLTTERNGLLSSRSWRLTKPLRKITAFVRRHKTLHLFAKGLLSVKRNGIIKTIKKIKAYKKKPLQELLSFLDRNTLLTHSERVSQENTVFPKKIKISIIAPLYNTPEQFLKEMIQSVKDQTYSNWELCLADGSNDEYGNIRRICKDFAKNDQRIKYKRLHKNLGISGNSNKAIEMSSGEYIGLLDHDDVLHPSALYEVMKAICDENADFIYTDETTFVYKLDNIIWKHHKPDYAIDTLRSCNYICHFSVFSRILLNQAGVFRSEFDGSQDYDLILRYTNIASKIYHIPKVLYFWRSHENSVISDINNKEYAVLAAKKAIGEHFTRHGLTAQIESTKVYSSFYRIKYNLIERPLVSIIISNKDSVSLLQNCLSSIIEKTTYDNYEIIIVGNSGKEEDIFKYCENFKRQLNVRIINWEGKEFNYGGLNNFGAQYASGKHLLFLNNDIEIITPNWIDEMLMYSQRSDVGAVGMKLYFSDNTIQHAGIILGIGEIAGYIFRNIPRDSIGYMARTHITQNMSAVTSACMMVRKSVFEEIGCFSPEFYDAFNEIDLCLKIRRAGYLIVWTPYAEAYHHEAKQSDYIKVSEDKYTKEVTLFKTKWARELAAGDPYYNCNFCLDKTDYTIKN
jgi:GT2 family glycosyltransferase/SAM-dependent methyltransferase